MPINSLRIYETSTLWFEIESSLSFCFQSISFSDIKLYSLNLN